jgi:tetratricopeptide (TPR) repeat protein
VTVCNFPTTSEAPLSIRRDAVSAEDNEKETQELELWDRISTTEGAERAEVLDELSHFAYKKNNYTECLQLIDTSIDIYFSLNSEFHTKKLIHLYEGKAFCHSNLDQNKEAAEAFETLAGYFCIDEDREGFLRAKRAAGREWYSAEDYEKSLEAHTIASKELDINTNDYSMGIDTLNIGMALEQLDRHQEAIPYFLTSRSLFKKAKNPEFVNWSDRHLTECYLALKNGQEAQFHAQHFFNYSKVTEDLDLEAYARGSLGQALRLQKQYEEAEEHLRRSLELLTLEGNRDWLNIIEANQELAAVLFAQGKNGEAKEILERISTIEETMCDA